MVINDITILFAGDFIPPALNVNIYSEDLLNLLAEKDFSIVNFEAPITYSNRQVIKTGSHFKIGLQAIKHIKDGHYDAVALANNHIRDYEDEGIKDTLEICDKHDIKTIGTGYNLSEARKPLRINLKGKRITFFNYCEHEFNIATKEQAGANPFDIKLAYYDITSERHRCDYIIVIYHGGLEYQPFPTPDIVRNFKFLVDVGADAVISHHTHQISGAIYYKRKPLIFGLGNFLAPTKGLLTDNWRIGLIVKLILKEDNLDFKLYPIQMNSSFNKVVLMDDDKKEKILKKINEINMIIENEINFENYWEEEFLRSRYQVLSLMKSNTNLEYRLRKMLSPVYKERLTVFKKNILLNTIRCDSLRARLIKILTSL